jgi:hypothetical protein
MSRGGEMPSRRPDGSPVPEPVRAHQGPDRDRGSAPAASDPSAEREARRRAREDRRGPRVERPEQRASARRRRLPPVAPLMQGVVSAGIVGIAVVTAAIMGSQDVHAWLIGLAVSVMSLLLAGAARLSRRPS